MVHAVSCTTVLLGTKCHTYMTVTKIIVLPFLAWCGCCCAFLLSSCSCCISTSAFATRLSKIDGKDRDHAERGKLENRHKAIKVREGNFPRLSYVIMVSFSIRSVWHSDSALEARLRIKKCSTMMALFSSNDHKSVYLIMFAFSVRRVWHSASNLEAWLQKKKRNILKALLFPFFLHLTFLYLITVLSLHLGPVQCVLLPKSHSAAAFHGLYLQNRKNLRISSLKFITCFCLQQLVL